MAKRVAKQITNPKDVDEVINITRKKAAEKNTIMEYFADFGKGPRFNTYDLIEIPAGKYGNTKKNKNKFMTTVGLWIFNKSFIEEFADILGYFNEPITRDKYEYINSQLSYALLEDKITLEQLKGFIMQTQILMGCCSSIAPSHTERIFDMQDAVNKKKKELIKEKYADGIKNKDLNQIKNLENELIDYAKDYLKDDPAVDMFNSGARSTWGNNVKNMYIMRGPIRLTDSSYDVVTTSYIDGLDPEDFSKVNDAAVGGPYSRARKTQTGGYLEKQFTNATQHIKVLPKGSDCGTKRHITVTLTEKNIKDWIYCFVIQGDKLIEITTDNEKQFIGKTVKMRFSAMCEYKKDGCICEKCMGTLYNRIGITNVGLGSMIMMSSLKNTAMKAFHDSTLKLAHINPDDVF